jgi:hypothetical protein
MPTKTIDQVTINLAFKPNAEDAFHLTAQKIEETETSDKKKKKNKRNMKPATSEEKPKRVFFRVEEEHNDEPNSHLDPQLKLQSFFKRAFEYRMINAIEATTLRKKADVITFTTLLLSTAVSILILDGSRTYFITLAAILSAVITALTAFSSYMNYIQRYEKHSTSVKRFASVNRDLFSMLFTCDDSDIADNFNFIAAQYNSAREHQPVIKPEIIKAYYDEHGNPLFPNIREEDLWNESLDTMESMAGLGLFTMMKRPNVDLGNHSVHNPERKKVINLD